MPETPVELVFATEAEKTAAIEKFDTSLGEEAFDKICNAPVKETKAPEAPVAPEKPVETPVVTPAAPVSTDPVWKRKGFKSEEEYHKAFDDSQAQIAQKTEFIKSKLSSPPDNSALEKLTEDNRRLQDELKQIKSAAPATASPAQQAKIADAEDTLAVLKNQLTANFAKRKQLLLKIKATPDLQLDADFIAEQEAVDNEREELNMKMLGEMSGLRGLYAEAKKVATAASEQTSAILKQRETESRTDQAHKLYESEMDEIDRFVSKSEFKDFAFSEKKTSRDVEGEYISWANSVASAFFGQPTSMIKSDEAKAAVQQVLNMLANGDPEVINACKAAGVDEKPSLDVQKYIDICDLLDYRDGIRLNPATGQKEQTTRLVPDGAGGFKKQPVLMKNIEDAYQHKLATNGVFKQRIETAYRDGGKDALAAVSKRNSGPVELDNASGATAIDAGIVPTQQQALETIKAIDPDEALRRKMSGDPTMWEKLEAALAVSNTKP